MMTNTEKRHLEGALEKKPRGRMVDVLGGGLCGRRDVRTAGITGNWRCHSDLPLCN